ncbi:oxidoreductase [Yinghuangia seranimata]|uniref:oxidoreductase n=1 Tax=Yinghuangia seranimata TaxID=408067 RepID=UPI00248D3A40|nr:oxidoreductase [Yinghuangia seranimata]MDI2126215.1 oxidoreductase [Yinghuangia seranimata]
MTGIPGDLTDAERRVWEAYRRGEPCDFQGGGLGFSLDWPLPAEGLGADWGPERTVRAEVLARLLVNGPEPEPGRMPALELVGARVVGDLVLRGTRVDAYVDLRGCRLEGRLILNDAVAGTVRLIGCVVAAVRARRLRTDGDLCLTTTRVADGVVLIDARIGTDLVLHGSRIGRLRDGRSVSGDGLQVERDLSAHNGFHASGTVSLRSARIGGRATFFGARLDAPEGLDSRGYRHLAFDGAAMFVEQSLHMSDRFHATGSIRLNDARIGDGCVFSNAHMLEDPDEALAMWRVQARTLHLDIAPRPVGRILLSGAQLGSLTDVPGTWPGRGRTSIGGMTYAVLRTSQPIPLRERLAWLADATPEYEPQPYEQLAAAFRASGQDEDARGVLLAKQRRNRETLRWPGRVWGVVQDVAIGYGYRPTRALLLAARADRGRHGGVLGRPAEPAQGGRGTALERLLLHAGPAAPGGVVRAGERVGSGRLGAMGGVHARGARVGAGGCGGGRRDPGAQPRVTDTPRAGGRHLPAHRPQVGETQPKPRRGRR